MSIPVNRVSVKARVDADAQYYTIMAGFLGEYKIITERRGGRKQSDLPITGANPTIPRPGALIRGGGQ